MQPCLLACMLYAMFDRRKTCTCIVITSAPCLSASLWPHTHNGLRTYTLVHAQADLIKEHLPAPSDDVLVLRCGPNPMMEAMKKALEGLGYAEDAQFQF